MRLIEDLFNLVAPHECLGCRAEGSLLCTRCAELLTTLPPRCYGCQRLSPYFRTCSSCRRQRGALLDSVWAVTTYEGLAKEVLHRLKFARAQAAAHTVASLLASTYSAEEGVLITHMPTANARVRERGYDQAKLIAQAFARQLSLPYLPLLARMGDQRQLGKDRSVRKQQLQTAFRPLHDTMLHKRHILLVDDVLTTGASCEAAARALKQAGAGDVSALVFAVA